MKKKMFLLIVMLVALFSVKEVNAASYAWKADISERFNQRYSCSNNKNILYSVKQNKWFELSCEDTIEKAIEGKISKSELIDGNKLIYVRLDGPNSYFITKERRIITYDYDYAPPGGGQPSDLAKICIYNSDLSSQCYARGIPSGIIKKGSVVLASSITANGETNPYFYADKDYKVVSYPTGFDSSFVLRPLKEGESGTSDPDTPHVSGYFSKMQKNIDDVLNCLSSTCKINIYSIKNNQQYLNVEYSNSISIKDLIEGKIDEDELIDGTKLYFYTFEDNGSSGTWIIAHDGPVICQKAYTNVLLPGDILKQGTLFYASSITANDKTSKAFYADHDYIVNFTQYNYFPYYILKDIPIEEDFDDESDEPNDPENPNEQVENYKLDLKCLSDKDGSHHCELYYNRVNSESNESNFEVKFRVLAKNIKGQITINDETEELESDKEYTVNGECSDADCKVLLAKFNTKDINKNSSSSMEIEPVSLKIDGEEKPINIENSKCEYSKVIENPKTSTYIIFVATIIFIVFGGLFIVLRKKEILTKV